MTAIVVKMTILERSLISRRNDERKNKLYISGIFSRNTQGCFVYNLSFFLTDHMILMFDVQESNTVEFR